MGFNIGSIIKGATSILTGDFASAVKEVATKYFPPNMSEAERKAFELELEKLLMEKQRQIDEATAEAGRLLNERVREYEGTAAELKTVPILGPLMIFLRGSQRVVWGFATLWMDVQWFFSPSSGTDAFTDKQETALIVINFLVLGFLFGERAARNVMPLITQAFGNKRG